MKIAITILASLFLLGCRPHPGGQVAVAKPTNSAALYEFHPFADGMGIWRCNLQTGETSYCLLTGQNRWWNVVPEPPPSFTPDQAITK